MRPITIVYQAAQNEFSIAMNYEANLRHYSLVFGENAQLGLNVRMFITAK